MTTSHFVVSQRDNAWQVSYKGDVTAPFGTRDEAVAAAIEMASKLDDHQAKVIAREADLRTETVWRADGLDLSESETANLAADIEHERDA